MKINNPEKITVDLIVIGGGLAGVCAAIAAAREGLSVALINNRPVLGGNSSSEIRMWTRGATGGGNKYAEEMGILGEIKLENLYKNPESNPYLWDQILFDFVYREKNIDLFLNTHINEVQTDTDFFIKKVSGIQLGSEREFSFESQLFIDATGDGTIGYLAGADFRQGKESKNEFGEDFAPDKSDNHTQGSSILFHTRKTDREISYLPPDYAYGIDHIRKYINQGHRTVNEQMDGTDYWWIEYGGDLDTIKDNEKISLELRKIVYGLWDYIKNSGEVNDVGNLALDWVGSIPGKRGSRRLIGDYVLTQNDIEQQKFFSDAVCYGGWYLDYHPEGGIYSSEDASEQIPVNIYTIPLRSLYSRNIGNLFMAGRIISTTYSAYSSTRIMNTCAMTGQAAGTAAAICGEKGVVPAELTEEHIDIIQQTLLKNDQYIPRIKNKTADKAQKAEIEVSSIKKLNDQSLEDKLLLDKSYFLVIPADKNLKQLNLLIDCHRETKMRYTVYTGKQPENYRPDRKLGTGNVTVNKGEKQWVNLKISEIIEDKKIETAVIKFEPASNLYFYYESERKPGVFLTSDLERSKEMYTPCCRAFPEQDIYSGSSVINGFNRPYGLPNLWVSDGIGEDGEWLTLDFKGKETINEIRLYFNPELSKEIPSLLPDTWADFHNLYPHTKTPESLVKDYSIFIWKDSGWKKMKEIKDNYQRFNIIKFDSVETEKLKFVFKNTHGANNIELFEVRVY